MAGQVSRVRVRVRVRWLVAGLVSGCLAVAPAAVGAAPAQPRLVVQHPVVVQLTAVDSVAADDAWAVGFTAQGPSSRTLVEHWDGASWSVVASPNQGKLLNRLDGVYAAGPDDVWAVGSFDSKQDGELHNLAMHWDGESWSVSNPPDAAPNRTNGLLSVTGGSASDVWAGGYLVNNDGRTLATLFRWDGSAWSGVHLVHGPVGDPVQGLTRFGGSYWAVGPCVGGCESAGWRGMVARLSDAGKWKDLRTPNLGRTVDADAAADGDLWTVADGAVARFDGAAWRRLPNPSIGRMVAVAAPTSGFTMVLAAEGAAVWDGSAWDAVPTPRVGQLLDVDLDSASSGWAVGSTGTAGLIEHWDGNRFTRYPLGHGGPTAPRGDRAAPATCYANPYKRDLSGAEALSQQSDDDPGIESAGAAGFTVTKACVVGLVEAFGSYSALHGPAHYETVTFYRNENGVPGAVVDRQNVQAADFQGHFLVPLHTVRLEPGSYFVSVVAHMPALTNGGWLWGLAIRDHNATDQWENPGGQLSDCLTWGDVGNCIGRGETALKFLVTLHK